jgi:hypothetical protein
MLVRIVCFWNFNASSANADDSGRMTGKPDPTRDKDLQLLIDGMEAIDHEAQTNFQK